jgi:hypothetical protein
MDARDNGVGVPIQGCLLFPTTSRGLPTNRTTRLGSTIVFTCGSLRTKGVSSSGIETAATNLSWPARFKSSLILDS